MGLNTYCKQPEQIDNANSKKACELNMQLNDILINTLGIFMYCRVVQF